MIRTAIPRSSPSSLALAAILTTATAAPLQARDRTVAYDLPDGPDVLQAKLSGPVSETYAVVCDSLVDDACDVVPGTYQLQTFDLAWRPSRSTVTIAADTAPSAAGGLAVPANVRFEFYSTTAGALSWDRPATPGLRYEVRRDGETVVDATTGTNFQEREARLLDRSHLYEIVALAPDGQRSEPARYFLRSYLDNPDPLNDPAPTPDAEPLAAPVNLRFDFYSSFAGALSWDRPATPALRYEVRRNGRTVVDGTDGIDYQERDARFVDTRYVYEVIAIAPDGRRSPPSVLTIDDFEQTSGPAPDPDPAEPGPEAPANLRADVYSRDNAELFWDRSVTPGLRYEIRRDGALVGRTDGTSFYDDELEGDTTYRYEVVALESERRSMVAAIEVVTPGSATATVPVGSGLGGTARDVIRLIATVSRYYESSVGEERPYVEQEETSSPYVFRDLSDPDSREVPGRSNSLLIDIDAAGTGTYSHVFTYRDLDTRQITRRVATRVHDGTSVAWSGTYYRNDSSSAREEVISFATNIRSTGERTRQQSGTFDSLDAGYSRNSVTYDLSVETRDGSNLNDCAPSSGVITFDGGTARDVRTGTFADTTSRIERREGERYWSVSERFLDGSLAYRYLTDSIDLTTYCDFPEL